MAEHVTAAPFDAYALFCSDAGTDHPADLTCVPNGSSNVLVNKNRTDRFERPSLMSPTMRNVFDVHVHRHGQCTVVHCSGRAVLNHGVDRLEEIVFRQLMDGRQVILDLAGVVELDARAIGVLAEISERALSGGHRIVIVGAEPRIERLLQLTGLDVFLSDRGVDAACHAESHSGMGSPPVHASM